MTFYLHTDDSRDVYNKMESSLARSKSKPSAKPRAPLSSPRHLRLGTTRSPVYRRVGNAMMTSFTLKPKRLSGKSSRLRGKSLIFVLVKPIVSITIQIRKDLLNAMLKQHPLPLQSLLYYKIQSWSQSPTTAQALRTRSLRQNYLRPSLSHKILTVVLHLR